MQSGIESMLGNPPAFNTEADLRSFITKIKQKIISYEKELLEEGVYTEESELLINQWRKKLLDIISKSKKKQDESQVSEKHNDIFETVKLVSRQIDKADMNLQLLDKSTLKLVGLNYSSKDIESEISKTREIIMRNKAEEKKEVVMLYLGLLVLLVVCLAIAIDKLFIR